MGEGESRKIELGGEGGEKEKGAFSSKMKRRFRQLRDWHIIEKKAKPKLICETPGPSDKGRGGEKRDVGRGKEESSKDVQSVPKKERMPDGQQPGGGNGDAGTGA